MLLTGGAILAGGGLLTQAGIDLIPGLKQSIGYTPEAIARGETYDLNNPDAYRDDFGDHLRSWLTGVSVGDVKKKARQQAIDTVNRSLNPAYERVKAGYKKLNLEAPDQSEFQYQGSEGTKAAEYRASDYLDQLKALKDASAAGVNISGLSNASPSAIDNAVRLHQKGEAEADRLRIKGENETDRLRIRGEALSDQATIFARQDAKEARQRADLLREQMRRDKQTEANRSQQFQIQQMQLGLDNRRLDMQEARDFRNDRNKAIMQIVQGMRSMGNSFAY